MRRGFVCGCKEGKEQSDKPGSCVLISGDGGRRLGLEFEELCRDQGPGGPVGEPAAAGVLVAVLPVHAIHVYVGVCRPCPKKRFCSLS